MLTIYYRMCGTRRVESAVAIGEKGTNVLFEDGSWNPKSGSFLTAAQAAAKVCSCVSCGALRLEEKSRGELDEQKVRSDVVREIYELSEHEPISRKLLSSYEALGWDYHSLEGLLEIRDAVAEALQCRLELEVLPAVKEKEVT